MARNPDIEKAGGQSRASGTADGSDLFSANESASTEDSSTDEKAGAKRAEEAGQESRASIISEHLDSGPASRRSRFSRILSKKSSKKDELPPALLPLTDLDRGVVGWEGQGDPKHPQNFSRSRQYWIIILLALVTFMTPLASSILAPGIKYYSAEFDNPSTTLGAMPVSIYLLGYAIGPLFLSPLSEIYGRFIVLSCSNVFFCIWFIGTGLAPNLASLIIFRLLNGIGGSATLTLGGSVIADVFPIERRGFAISIWTIGPTMEVSRRAIVPGQPQNTAKLISLLLIKGPSFGPVIGAFIASTIGWRWTSWLVMIPSTVATILFIILLPETNSRVLMRRKVAALRKELNRSDLVSCYETEQSRALSKWAVIQQGLTRPLKFLFLCPMIAILSLYISFVYGTIYLMYNTVAPVFEGQYGWGTGVSGLPFLALGFGYGVGLVTFSVWSDRVVVSRTKRNGGVYEPEMRLPIMLWYALATPLTFFWYGWSAQYKTHWIVPIIGLAPLGVGMFGIYMAAQAYIIDAYPVYAASGLAAFAVLRSLTAAFLPLAGTDLFDHLGLGWGNSVLGFICLAMIPIPVLIGRFGTRIRKSHPLKM
ncbi:major facilitator superfamily domain-containing protein [Apiospora rasikravindrae]|uniref:Major facilitator superfamily domain-containing protein n=1 Tax=Apiospora rasikravindrae TaxID=990691 RepID=A0ABR1U1N6_9PEZI